MCPTINYSILMTWGERPGGAKSNFFFLLFKGPSIYSSVPRLTYTGRWGRTPPPPCLTSTHNLLSHGHKNSIKITYAAEAEGMATKKLLNRWKSLHSPHTPHVETCTNSLWLLAILFYANGSKCVHPTARFPKSRVLTWRVCSGKLVCWV